MDNKWRNADFPKTVFYFISCAFGNVIFDLAERAPAITLSLAIEKSPTKQRLSCFRGAGEAGGSLDWQSCWRTDWPLKSLSIMHRIDGWPHVYRRSNGALYYVRRVSKDLAAILSEQQFKRSLRHRDQRIPAFKAAYDAVHREVETYIAKARSGHAPPQAQRRYEEAALRAQRLGFDLRPMDTLAQESVSVEDLLNRLIAVEAKLGGSRAPEVDGGRPLVVLGTRKHKYRTSWRMYFLNFWYSCSWMDPARLQIRRLSHRRIRPS